MAEPVDESTISLVDLLVVLYKRKWLILSVTLVAAALVLVVNLVGKYLPPDSPWNWLPDVYQPRAEILVKCEQQGAGSISSLLSSGDFSSLASLLGRNGRVITRRSSLTNRIGRRWTFKEPRPPLRFVDLINVV